MTPLSRDRPAAPVRIVHLGLGNFFRAHQAWYTAVAPDADEWGIAAFTGRSRLLADALTAQGGVYTLVVRGAERDDCVVLGSVVEAHPGTDLAAWCDLLSRPATAIVTLTVTEAAYRRAPDGGLDRDDPDVRADVVALRAGAAAGGRTDVGALDGGADAGRASDGGAGSGRTDVGVSGAGGAVRTVPGRLVAGLAARRAAGAGPIAVVCCDNLPGNGAVVARVVTGLAELVDAELVDAEPVDAGSVDAEPMDAGLGDAGLGDAGLGDAGLSDAGLGDAGPGDAGLGGWIRANVSFVTTMVDRITPETTADDVAAVAELTGLADAAPVVTEPFTEWVLQGDFPGGRPDWAAGGARFVADVGPYEQRKLWLLNGGHSLLAYAAGALGHETVAQAAADPRCRDWLDQWWDEATPHLPLPAAEIADYRAALLDRWANPRIRHRLAQIAADGSQKLPIRILPVLRLEREAGRDAPGAVRVLAAWIRHLRGAGVPVRDAAADTFRTAAVGDPEQAVRAVLPLLDAGLHADDALIAAVVSAMADLAAVDSPRGGLSGEGSGTLHR